MYFGQFKTPYSFTARLLSQAEEGARLLMADFTFRYSPRKLKELPQGSFEYYYAVDMLLYPTSFCTVCLVELDTFLTYKSSVVFGELDRAREAFEMYDSVRFHSR
jgi:hypothetical protein